MRGSFARTFRLSVVGSVALAASSAGAGEITTRTLYAAYPMGGSTPRAIVDYFHNRPLAGDRGPALANLRYATSLRLSTRQTGGGCRVAAVSLNLAFTMTLPQAMEEARMSRATRTIWRQLVAFARAHENGHRASYLQCARNFVARAKRLGGDSCYAVESAARQLLRSIQDACEAKQVGYDRREARRAGNLALFRAARMARR